MGRSEKREHAYSPVDEGRKKHSRRRGTPSRSRSQTYSLSPKRDVPSRRRDNERNGNGRRRSRSHSRGIERERYRPYASGFNGGGGGHGSRRYADGRSAPFGENMSNGNTYLCRDNPEPSPCLGVFGMSLHTSERDLKHLFGRYGEVESVQIVYDRFTGRSRGFGFVYFTSTKDSARAKEHMSDAVIDGMKVRVDYSVTRGGGPYRHARKGSKSPVRYNSRSRSRSR